MMECQELDEMLMVFTKHSNLGMRKLQPKEK